MARLAIALLAAAVLGCAQAAPAPAGPPSVDGQAAGTVDLTGHLSRKGPAETSYWAVTDARREGLRARRRHSGARRPLPEPTERARSPSAWSGREGSSSSRCACWK